MMIGKKIVGKKGSLAVSASSLVLEPLVDSAVQSSSSAENLVENNPVTTQRLSYSLYYPVCCPIKPQRPYGKLSQEVVHITTDVSDKGLQLSLRQGVLRKHFEVVFPPDIWYATPQEMKDLIRDNLTFLSSMELPLMFPIEKVKYSTPLPQFKSFFMELMLRCLFYGGDSDGGKTLQYLSRVSKVNYLFTEKPLSMSFFPIAAKEKSITTITFGKESLLSFGLSRELGLQPLPATIIEPDMNLLIHNEHWRSFENKHKEVLISRFEKEFDVTVYRIYNGFADLRFYGNWDLTQTELGYSSQLTEYMFFLLPLLYHTKSRYMIYGNEYSCDDTYDTPEGFRANPVYDQSSEWTNHMNTMLQTVSGGSVQLLSLVQPLHEIAVSKILYQRYPELAKYQMSCHMDNEGAQQSRWCNACSKCARIFAFMKALGFNSDVVGLKDMFGMEFKKHFSLFNRDKEMRSFDGSGLSRDEQLFAFYLAAKRGVKGDLMELFRKDFLPEAQKRERELRAEFFTVHPPSNIPPHLWKKLKPIFERELRK